MACWAGWRGGATRNRSCSSPCAWWWLPPPLRTRSAYPPPWGLTRRDGAGRERLPAPHGKPPQAVSRCAVGPVLRDHRPAAGCRADRGSTAGGTGLAAGLGASQDGAELSGAARNPPVGARRLAHRHRAGAWRRVCAAAPGHGHAAALGCRQRGATDAGRAGAEHGVGAAPDPTP